jgi:hypothetical protein
VLVAPPPSGWVPVVGVVPLSVVGVVPLTGNVGVVPLTGSVGVAVGVVPVRGIVPV